MDSFSYIEEKDQVTERGIPVDDNRFKADITCWDDKDRSLFVVRHLGQGVRKYFRKKPFDFEQIENEIVANGRTAKFDLSDLRKSIKKHLSGIYPLRYSERDDLRDFML